ncbi:MAG: ribosome biogenesis GTPase Der [Terracidiphilus sp.]
MPSHRRLLTHTTGQPGQLPLVAIVGRPNVGKSTLFNRLTRSRRSIVGNEPGITRDRIYGEYDWAGRRFRLVDTGGIVPDDPELIPQEIYNQAKVALDEADALVLVVDVRTELASPDYDLVRLLLRGGKPVFLAVNKVEGDTMAAEAENFRRLGIRQVFPVSSEHGQGLGELLDAISAAIPEATPANTEGGGGFNPRIKPSKSARALAPEPAALKGHDFSRADATDLEEPGALAPEGSSSDSAIPVHRTHGEYEQLETSVAIIGRPNVGKSTLLNALTGTERAIVSPVPGTTRDAVDEVVDFEGARFRFVDTAGIRRKGKTHLMAEKLSVVMARRHLEAADVALLVIDATAGVTASDATIGGYAHESGRSVIIVVNKWDLVTTGRTDGKPPADREIFERQLRNVLKYLSYARVIFLSAKVGTNVPRVMREVKAIAAERRKRVTTGEMNRFLERIDFQRAPVPMAKRVRIFYMTQAAVAPPTFVLFTDRAIELHFAFKRFLENQIREAFGFKGTPIWFKVKGREKGAGKKGKGSRSEGSKPVPEP